MITILKALRLPFVIVSGLSTTVIWYYLDLDFDKIFIIVLSGIITSHISGNLWNDFFDFEADYLNTNPTPFSGGSRVLQKKKISKKGFLFITIIFSLISCSIGIFLLIKFFSIRLLTIILLASLLTLFYTALPLRLSYNYLGEITIFLLFGPFIYLGIKEIINLKFDYKVFALSIILGILTTKILLVNQMPDMVYDIKAGKRTITTALKEKMFYILIILNLLLSLLLYTIGFKYIAGLILIALTISDFTVKKLWKKSRFSISSMLTILSFIFISTLLLLNRLYKIF